MQTFDRAIDSYQFKAHYEVTIMFDEKSGWRGYADAKPSESIQKHELPALAVAVAFPYKPGEEVLNLPIKQYKGLRP